MKRNSRTGQFIAIIVALFAVMLMVLQYLFLGVYLKKESLKNSKDIAGHVSREAASSVETYFRDAFTITKTYTGNLLVYKKNNIPRQTIYQMMKGSLAESPNLLAFWTMWEPNAYDNKDKQYANTPMHDINGSFAMAFYYCGSTIMFEINDPADYSDHYYTIPKKIKQPVILDPFYYQYHGNKKLYYETSIVYPVLKDTSFLGVVAVDIDMYELQRLFKTYSVFDSGFVSILSNSGTIVTHPDSAFVNTNIIDYFQENGISITDSLRLGKTFLVENTIKKGNRHSLLYFYPINLKYMAAPWYIMVEIPYDDIIKGSFFLTKIALYFLIASLLLLFYLVFNIIDRRRNEKLLLKTLDDLQYNKQDLEEANEKLHKSEQLLQSIFNQTFSFVGLTLPDGTLLRVNSSALDFIGMKEDSVIGKKLYNAPWWGHSEQERARISEAIDKAAAGDNILIETTHVDTRNNISNFLFSIKPIFDKKTNKIIYLIPEGIDITSLKQTEQELLKYQEHLEDLVKERVQEIDQLNEELMSSNEELVTTNDKLSDQKRELEQILEKLQKAQERLIVSEKMASLGIFTAGIAHEINNPLNYISVGTYKLFETLEELQHHTVIDNEDLKKDFAIIGQLKKNISIGVERITEIISSLRNYSRGGADVFVPYDIHSCIKDALILLHNKYKNRVAIIEKYGSLPEITCIPGKMNQMFINLISNAVDAITDKGTITIESKLLGKNEIEIKISDTGTGIEKDNISKLFDPFYTTKPVGEGTGLGLYIVYGIIEQHKGSIKVKSGKDEGTTFIVRLPINNEA